MRILHCKTEMKETSNVKFECVVCGYAIQITPKQEEQTNERDN